MKTYRRAKKLFESNYGRYYGWYVEYNDEIVGALIHPTWIEMWFFEKYRDVPLTNLKGG
jgi:hypothetical protein